MPVDPVPVPADIEDQAEAFAELFRLLYLQFHRRDGKRSELSGASRAVLLHLSLSGPLTVGEAALHLDRAQSVVSEIVQQLERKGLLEREADPADRRRTLIWLTDKGFELLRRDREVLSIDLLRQAMAGLPARERAGLLAHTRALIAAAERLPAAGRGRAHDPVSEANDPVSEAGGPVPEEEP